MMVSGPGMVEEQATDLSCLKIVNSVGPVVGYMWTGAGGGLKDGTFVSGWMMVMYVTQDKVQVGRAE